MGIQRIKIDQQLAEIGIRSTPARLRISSPDGQLTIKNVRPQMSIEREAPSFTVNKKKQNSESGLKAPLELAQKFRNEGRAAALSAARQAKEDGNYLGALNKPPPDKVPSLAKNKANSRLGMKNTNVGLMPQSAPEVKWNKGYMRINWSRHSVVIDYSGEYMPDLSVDPKYSVEVFLRKEPYFRVMVEEAVSSSGRYVNSAV